MGNTLNRIHMYCRSLDTFTFDWKALPQTLLDKLFEQR